MICYAVVRTGTDGTVSVVKNPTPVTVNSWIFQGACVLCNSVAGKILPLTPTYNFPLTYRTGNYHVNLTESLFGIMGEMEHVNALVYFLT